MPPTPKQHLLHHILQTFHLPPEMSEFDLRHNKQKLICFLQNKEIVLNYNFSWYAHGPYSPALAKDLFAIPGDHDLVADTNTAHLDSDLRASLESLSRKLGRRALDRDYMEVLGSSAYLLGYNTKADLPNLLHKLKGIPAEKSRPVIQEWWP